MIMSGILNLNQQKHQEQCRKIYKNDRRKLVQPTTYLLYNMQEPSKNRIFISQLATMKANFFLSITDFCIKELATRIQTITEENQLQSQEIYRQIQSLQDPELRKLFIYHQSEDDSGEKSQQIQEEIIEKNKKKGRQKKKPSFTAHKPKAPTTSYLLFLHENKANIAARRNITSISEVTKAASEEWKKLTQSEKQKYCKKADEQKTKYREAMKIYKEKYANEIQQEKRKRQLNYKTKWMQKKKIIKLIQEQKVVPQDNSSSEDEQSSSHSFHENDKGHKAIRTPLRSQKQKQNEVMMIDNSNEDESYESLTFPPI